jgi:hypothetical protein
MRSARTVEPNGPCGTGQPCALTQNVLATPKSLFDCITPGKSRACRRRYDIRPARTCIDPVDAGGGVGLDVAAFEGDRRAVARQALPAHGMARGADRDRPLRRRGLREFGAQRGNELVARLARTYDVFEHGCGVEAARIVDHDAIGRGA